VTVGGVDHFPLSTPNSKLKTLPKARPRCKPFVNNPKALNPNCKFRTQTANSEPKLQIPNPNCKFRTQTANSEPEPQIPSLKQQTLLRN